VCGWSSFAAMDHDSVFLGKADLREHFAENIRRSIVGPNSARQRRSSITCRRLSKSFREACQIDSDDDFFSIIDSECEEWESCDSSPRNERQFACQFRLFDDSESNCESDIGRELEDMFQFASLDLDDEDYELNQIYDFDLERVAAALRRGAGQEELQELIAEDMATNLENMMIAPPLENLSEPSPLMAGDLAGRMTPPTGGGEQCAATAAMLAGRMTPPLSQEGKHDPSAEDLASRLANLPNSCRRRSSLTTTPHGRRISQAMQSARTEHRRSLVKAMAEELENSPGLETKEVARHCAINSIRNHRLSLMQAANVLEAAGFGGEQDNELDSTECFSPSHVKMQLELVQRAVDGARRKHRQSIAMAVRSLNEEVVSQSPLSGSSRDRVQQIISTALCEEASKPDSCEKSKRQARFKPQSLVALMATRTSEKGRPVHCGPAPSTSGRRKKEKRGGC